MKIIVEPDEVWDYFRDNEELLSMSSTRIAYNDDYGTEIYITALFDEPQIFVMADDMEIDREDIFGAADCAETAQRLYDEYLTAEVFRSYGLLNEDGGGMSNNQDLIDMREGELDNAVEDFLMTVVDDYMQLDADLAGSLISDFKEKAMEYLSKEYELPIYRPMMLEDVDTGEEFFEEYPYECMVDKAGK